MAELMPVLMSAEVLNALAQTLFPPPRSQVSTPADDVSLSVRASSFHHLIINFTLTLNHIFTGNLDIFRILVLISME